MLKLTALFCSCLLCCTALAQQQKHYVFTRFGKINGLAADAAYCVTQDKEGFIWIGTEDGLQRYDGTRFITFHHNAADPGSIPFDGVGFVHYDKKGRLLMVCSDNAIGFFDTHSFRYTPIKTRFPNDVRKNNIVNIQEDDDGIIHLTLAGYGVATYSEKNNEFDRSYNTLPPNGSGTTNDLNKDKVTGNYWVSAQNGFDLYDSKTKQFVPHTSNPIVKKINEVLPEEKTSIAAKPFTDRKGRFWTFLWSYKKGGPEIYSYNPADGKWTTYKDNIDAQAKAYHTVDGIFQQRNGTIWAFGVSLLAKYNEKTNLFEDVRNLSFRQNGVDIEYINNIFEDAEFNLWIPTSGGLYLFNPGSQVFTNLPNKRDDGIGYTNSTDAILQAKNGIIYISSWGAGLFAYDSNFNIVPNPIIPVAKANAGVSMWDMHERSNGEIWMGLQDGHLYIYDQPAKKLHNLRLAAFEGLTIRQVAEDSMGNMWMGTQRGLVVKCAGANWHDTATAFKVMQRVKGHITKLVADKNNVIWVCTDRYGLFKLNATDGSILQHIDDQSPENIRLQTAGVGDILRYNDSILLIASGTLHILNERTNTITYFGLADGLPNFGIRNITKDKLGYVWLSMNNGICRLRFENLYVNNFGPEDGIENNHFQLNAAHVLRDGRMVMGTTTDILLFDPAKIHVSRKAVPVSIAAFKVFDKFLRVDSLLQLKKIALPYTDNSITIDITTHSYTQTNGIMYFMEGVDKEWHTSANREVVYNYLAPGSYTFKTKVTKADRVEADRVTELKIVIEPPFWNTWWFYGLLVLSAIAVFYLFDRERLMRIRSTEKIRTDIALNLHHDVSTALNHINLLSEMARMKADRDLGKSKELIEQISEKSNTMIIGMDDMLWSIDPANDNMEKTLLRMTEFADALRNRHEAQIVLEADQNIRKLKLDMKKRYVFFIIFKDSLRSVVQYSGGKQTQVNIRIEKSNLLLSMHDPVALNDKDTNTMKSIEEMKSYAADTRATLDIQYDKNGTGILLSMPLQ